MHETWKTVSSEMVIAIRGKRSSAMLSKRLGYRTNAVSAWVAGRRFPTVGEFLRVCALLKVDVNKAFVQFHPATAELIWTNRSFTPDRWLSALRGRTPLKLIAERAKSSRFAVSRWLKGQTHPRLPEFLCLVEAITDRVSDLADALVGIKNLPTLLDKHRRRAAARNLSVEYPESEAILRIMETESYRQLPRHRPGVLAAALGLIPEREQQILDALETAGVLEALDGRYRHLPFLTVDTTTTTQLLNRIKAHWARVALERLDAPRDSDWLGYNLMSLSETDLERVRDILRNVYREIRALAASSEPVESAALLNLHLVTF